MNAIEFSNLRPPVAAMNQIRNVVHSFNFLQPRPQVAAMKQIKGAFPHWESCCCKPAISTEGKGYRSKGYRRLFNLCTKSEMSNLEFFRLLPLADPDTARVGSWPWVRCSPELRDSRDDDVVDTFIDTAIPTTRRLTQTASHLRAANSWQSCRYHHPQTESAITSTLRRWRSPFHMVSSCRGSPLPRGWQT